MPTCLQQVIEADDVAFNIHIRVIDAVAYACLGCQVDHDVEMVLLEDRVDERFVADGSFDKDVLHQRGGCNGIDPIQPPLLKAHLVVVVHVVKRDDYARSEGSEETNHKICSNEPWGAGYEDGFIVEIDGCFHFVVPFTSSSIPDKFPSECAE